VNDGLSDAYGIFSEQNGSERRAAEDQKRSLLESYREPVGFGRPLTLPCDGRKLVHEFFHASTGNGRHIDDIVDGGPGLQHMDLFWKPNEDGPDGGAATQFA